MCTALVYTPTDSTADGNATVVNSCRALSPTAPYLNASSTLQDMGPPGHWTEVFEFKGAPAASYNIILDGVDPATGVPYAVEYDCLIGTLGEVRLFTQVAVASLACVLPCCHSAGLVWDLQSRRLVWVLPH